ncbi:GGDEF domain-containing protein [Vibrio olivae]
MRRPAPNSADICLALTVLLSFSLSLFDIASGTQRLSFLDMEMDDFILHLVFVPAVICGQSIFLLASYMIDNNRNLMRLAQKDSLTNMLNRRAFYEQLNQYYQELKESHGQGAIIIADIDFFKKKSMIPMGMKRATKGFCILKVLSASRFGIVTLLRATVVKSL